MIKTKRKCSIEGCNNPHFAKGFCKWHQYKRPDFNKPQNKKSKLIARRSKKRAKEEAEYLRLNKLFLQEPDNKLCPVAVYFLNTDKSNESQVFWSNNYRTTEVHHKAGRIGKLLLYIPYWLAVSYEGHKYIHNNPEFSYKMGWLIKSTTVRI